MTVFFPHIPFRHVGIGAFCAERWIHNKKWARTINCNDYGTQELRSSVLSWIGVFSKPHIPYQIIEYTQKHITKHFYRSNKKRYDVSLHQKHKTFKRGLHGNLHTNKHWSKKVCYQSGKKTINCELVLWKGFM